MADDSSFYKRYRNKSSDELIDITDNPDYLDEAKLTAIYILEERGKSSDNFLALKKRLIPNVERIIVQRRNRSRYDNFFRRLVAAIIDSMILGLFGFLLDLFLITEILWLAMLVGFIRMVLPYAYSISMHTEYGQTLGKMAMSIKVIHKDESCEIKFGQALMRDIVPVILIFTILAYEVLPPMNVENFPNAENFVNMMPWLVLTFLSFMWFFIELVSMLFDERKRAIHDLIAKTVVVKVLD